MGVTSQEKKRMPNAAAGSTVLAGLICALLAATRTPNRALTVLAELF